MAPFTPLSLEEAKKQVNPDLDDTEKDGNGLTAADRSALALVAGSAANAAYWDSRSELEQLVAQATGHAQVIRATGEPAKPVDGSDLPVIEGTATDVPQEPQDAQERPPAPSPDNPTEAVATLRKQLEDAGIRPEA